MSQKSGSEVSVNCGKKEIQIHGAIFISSQADSVFYFFGSMKNDPLWRSEIIRCETSGEVQISQYSFLSRKLPEYRQDYKVAESDAENRTFLARSVPESRYFQSSRRTVENQGEACSRVVYEIAFDRALIREALGFDIPDFLLKFQMKRVTRKYLDRLKEYLEAKP